MLLSVLICKAHDLIIFFPYSLFLHPRVLLIWIHLIQRFRTGNRLEDSQLLLLSQVKLEIDEEVFVSDVLEVEHPNVARLLFVDLVIAIVAHDALIEA